MDRQFESLRDELERALGGLDARQTQLRPAGIDNWSIQQIVGHLLLTYRATVEAIDARIAKGAITKATPSMMQRAAQFTVLRVGYFPRGRLAPEKVIAATNEAAVPGGMLIARITTAILEMDRKMSAGGAIFGSGKQSINHMALGPLSMDQWRRFHLVHGRHHIRQIVAIRKANGIQPSTAK